MPQSKILPSITRVELMSDQKNNKIIGNASIENVDKVDRLTIHNDVSDQSYLIQLIKESYLRLDSVNEMRLNDQKRSSSEKEKIIKKLAICETILANFYPNFFNSNIPEEKKEQALQSFTRDVYYKKDPEDISENKHTQSMLKQANAAFNEGNKEQADLILRTLSKVRELEYKTEDNKRCEESAEILITRGTYKRLTFEYEQAAKIFLKAAKLVKKSNQKKHAEYLEMAGSTLYEKGYFLGQELPISKSLEIRRNALKRASKINAPELCAKIKNNIGNTLCILGFIQKSKNLYAEAIDEFIEALSIRTKEKNPYQWADTKINQANALRALGKYEMKIEYLQQAVKINENVLEIYTKDKFPHQWAIIQNNLGNARLELWKSSTIKHTQILEDALNAYKQALSIRSKEANKLKWAGTQNNYGDGLFEKGKHFKNIKILNDAHLAYSKALAAFKASGKYKFFIDVVERNIAELNVSMANITKKSNHTTSLSNYEN